jgi:hypothetical protein
VVLVKASRLCREAAFLKLRLVTKYYILFLSLTVVLMALAYLLLAQFDKNAGWLHKTAAVAGILLTSAALVTVYRRYMKNPHSNENQ